MDDTAGNFQNQLQNPKEAAVEQSARPRAKRSKGPDLIQQLLTLRGIAQPTPADVLAANAALMNAMKVLDERGQIASAEELLAFATKETAGSDAAENPKEAAVEQSARSDRRAPI
jgi:hypothetical protein